MAKIKAPPPPAKLICGIILSPALPLTEVLQTLENTFGPADFKSEPFAFSPFTDYYDGEMGDGLTRHFISFTHPVHRTRLPEIKTVTNALEDKFAVAGKRRVNLDPGLLTLGQLFLASTKDNFFRVYLDKGIFGEVTLYFKEGEFFHFPWTYPDYQSAVYKSIFLNIRGLYKKQIQN